VKRIKGMLGFFQDLGLKYIDNWSLWLDFKIILKTIPAIFCRKGAW